MKTFLLGRLRRAKGLTPGSGAGKAESGAVSDQEHDGFRQMTFAFAAIALAAKLSVCDGKVTPREMAAFRELFPLPGEEQGQSQRLFEMACEDSLPASHYARQIMQLFPDQIRLRLDLLDRLGRLALADGPLQPPEQAWLKEIISLMDVSGNRKEPPLVSEPAAMSGDPYALLGVTRKASAAEIKNAYRRRIRELHPDSLTAKGYTPEAIARADDVLAALNAAYGEITRKHKRK